jgi:cell division protein FtsL
MSGRICFVLTLILVACALSVVNAHYQFRRLFIELERACANWTNPHSANTHALKAMRAVICAWYR